MSFAYRMAIEDTLKMTPLELFYDRELSTMFDAVLPHLDDHHHANGITWKVLRRPVSLLEFVEQTTSSLVPDPATSSPRS